MNSINVLDRRLLMHLLRDESGQDLIEYALVAGLIGLATLAAVSGMSAKLRTLFGVVGGTLTNAT